MLNTQLNANVYISYYAVHNTNKTQNFIQHEIAAEKHNIYKRRHIFIRRNTGKQRLLCAVSIINSNLTCL